MAWSKVCTKCFLRKNVDEFYKDTHRRGDGYQARCKECVKAINLAHYHKKKQQT